MYEARALTQPRYRTTQRAVATNRLLAGLPAADRGRLLDRACCIELGTDDVLHEPGKRIRAVYFPTGGSISLVARQDGHDQLQVGLIGDEGMLGTALVLGVGRAPTLARVQDAGTAWQVGAASFIEELELSIALRGRLQRYVHVVMSQATQTVACTRFHVVEARLARWLLMTRDRAHSDQFHSTHEALASILGVRRAGVTNAAGALQRQRLIRYSRGEITVLDLRGLETAACDCYLANCRTYSRTMAQAHPVF